jgi:hypothetical protein
MSEHIDMSAERIDAHTLKDMAVTVAISKLKACWDDLALQVNASRGNPGPPVWEGLLLLGERIEDLYDITFTHEQRRLDE